MVRLFAGMCSYTMVRDGCAPSGKPSFHVTQHNFRKPEAGGKKVSWIENVTISVYGRVSFAVCAAWLTSMDV